VQVSVTGSIIESMFELLAGLDDPGLLDVMRDAQRAERTATARRLLAAGRLCQQRLARASGEHDYWCVDDWEEIAAELGAELGISRGRASSEMHYGQTLLERLPQLGAVFLAGEVDYRVIAAIVFRTALISDVDVLAKIDETLARKVPQWNKLSREKVTQLVDWLIVDLDPEAVRVARQSDIDRHIEVEPSQNGLAEIWGSVRAPDAAALDNRLNELAATVCPDDPRTKRQRRADALTALAGGAASMVCACGSDDCPAAHADSSPGEVVIHVLAEAATIEGTSAKPGYLPGYGAVPADTVEELAKRAKIRPVIHPNDLPAEPQYRRSAALADFIRCRVGAPPACGGLTCQFPGCDAPAQVCDLDHTVPWPIGLTHPSNIKLYCRIHHLLWGWLDRQLPDGTVIRLGYPLRRVA
jgi:Domain of unknown function (DUF222)